MSAPDDWNRSVAALMIAASIVGCGRGKSVSAPPSIPRNAPACGALMGSAQRGGLGGEGIASLPSYRSYITAAFKDEMSDAFVLEEAMFSLDGVAVCGLKGTRLHEIRAMQAFEGAIAPGEHEIDVELVFRGNGSGIFSYLKGYRFRARSSRAIEAARGERIQVLIEAQERGGPTTPLEERPMIVFGVWSARR